MFTIDKYGNAVFPEGVEQIDNDAFYNNKELRVAVIPDTVKKIGRCAFCGCENLEKLVLSEGLESIEERAFANCSKLKSFVMPDSVTEIERNVFRDVGFEKPVYNRDKTILYVYKRTGRSDVIILPETVKRIFSGAFTGNMFNDIVLHHGLEHIDSEAFFNCILCEKLIVHCSTDKIKGGAFWNFRPMPEFYFTEGVPDYTELLRMCGVIPVKRADELDIPNFTPLKRNKLEKLVSECSREEPDKMIKVAEFFSQSGKSEFYEAAANFWYYRAMLFGSEKAEKIINEKCNGARKMLPAVAWPDIGEESGERLYALGFSFFKRKRTYNVAWPDENGIVEVTAYAGSDGPDEDGVGREEYYDWWLLEENLKEIPGISGILGYSKHDKRTNEDKFRKRYEEAVERLKAVKEIRRRIEKLFEEYKNESN